ncbi:MAG: GNAT family N-acetyltransferase [Weeksellaceae bacterium]|jgi:ElaA protein|nr:GNAT family N-acetyltransferase [Weeksellaceae bacterium]
MNLIWHFKKFEEFNPNELYAILRLRNDVFIVEQKCIYNECDNKDPKCFHLWCTQNNKIIGYCRIVPPGVSYKEASFGRIVSHPDYRHLKIGHSLMRYLIQIIQNFYPSTPIRISAQTYLKKFYESYGFEQVSEEYLEDNLPHMEMLKKEFI